MQAVVFGPHRSFPNVCTNLAWTFDAGHNILQFSSSNETDWRSQTPQWKCSMVITPGSKETHWKCQVPGVALQSLHRMHLLVMTMRHSKWDSTQPSLIWWQRRYGAVGGHSLTDLHPQNTAKLLHTCQCAAPNLHMFLQVLCGELMGQMTGGGYLLQVPLVG